MHQPILRYKRAKFRNNFFIFYSLFRTLCIFEQTHTAILLKLYRPLDNRCGCTPSLKKIRNFSKGPQFSIHNTKWLTLRYTYIYGCGFIYFTCDLAINRSVRQSHNGRRSITRQWKPVVHQEASIVKWKPPKPIKIIAKLKMSRSHCCNHRSLPNKKLNKLVAKFISLTFSRQNPSRFELESLSWTEIYLQVAHTIFMHTDTYNFFLYNIAIGLDYLSLPMHIAKLLYVSVIKNWKFHKRK